MANGPIGLSGLAYALTVIGGVLVPCTAAFSDDGGAFLKLLGNPQEQQHVINAAARSTVMLQNPCPATQFAIEKRYVPLKPVAFDETGKILAGAWKQIVDAEGCGAKRVLNVLVTVQAANSLATAPLLPGLTHATPVLQQDTVRYAVQSLATVRGGREPNCKIGYVADTEFVVQEDTTLPGAKGPSWRELWTLVSCTQKMLVPIHFVPDATGTTILPGPGTDIRIVPLTGSGRGKQSEQGAQ